MKKINLNINADDSTKKITVSGKIYFWERVECVITGLSIKSISTVRAAIYDGDTQVVRAVNFATGNFNSIYCEFLLQTQELQSALSDTEPNVKKNFTIYIWDEFEEEMVSVGTLPIYNNPYIEDATFENITIQSNFRIQYSTDGGSTWSEEVPEHVSNIRFSIDGGANWQNSIFLSPIIVTEDSNSNASISDIDASSAHVTIMDGDGKKWNLTLEQLQDMSSPQITIIED